MDINYLSKLKETPTLNGWTNKGFSIEDIHEIEIENFNGKEFPKAYREFLRIAGKTCYFTLSMTNQTWMNQHARKYLEKEGVSIPGDFWVVYQRNSCDQFGFFFIDESEEDPTIFEFQFENIELEKPLYQKKNPSKFSEFVVDLLEQLKSIEGTQNFL